MMRYTAKSDNDASTSCKKFKRTVNTFRGKARQNAKNIWHAHRFERLLLWVILKGTIIKRGSRERRRLMLR